MDKPKISVAMTTYNGEQFLQEQLKSIYEQSYPIDELVACDDGSTDNTEIIMNKFIEENSLVGKWKYIRNEVNLGAMKNFIHTASLCDGDIIFFCDQDDEWDIDKIRIMKKVFDRYSDALVVSCSEAYMDINGNMLEGQSVFHRESDKKKILKKVSFSSQIKTMHSPGLTLAFRKSFLDETSRLTYDDGLTYDITMGLAAAAKKGMYRLYKPLVYRRIHDGNLSSPDLSLSSRVNNYSHHIEGRKLQLRHMEVIRERYGECLTKREKRNLDRRIRDTKKTIRYLETKNVIGLLGLCLSLNPMNNNKLNLGNVLIALISKIKDGKRISF